MKFCDMNYWNLLRTNQIPTKEREALLPWQRAVVVSSAPFSLAWHTFWHSLTCWLFVRSSADINTFERLTRVCFKSLRARNIRPPLHIQAESRWKKKPERHEDRFGFTIGTSTLNERFRTRFPHKFPFPLRARAYMRTKAFDWTRIFIANMHTITIISTWTLSRLLFHRKSINFFCLFITLK